MVILYYLGSLTFKMVPLRIVYALPSVLIQGDTASNSNNEESKDSGEITTEDEVMIFHTNCSHCNSPVDTRMKLVDIL